jgi:DNA-binding transcriptional ArsR family regulator
MTEPRLFWDWGTAYDLFISLVVLHEPAEFGVRRAWAAGVRARLPAEHRETLEQSQNVVHIPFHWVYALPDPKDGAAVLWALQQLPPSERVPALVMAPNAPAETAVAILQDVAARGTWDGRDREALMAADACKSCAKTKKAPPPEKLATVLNWWAHAEEFGERYLQALRAYHEVFFAEEERRIQPALQAALSRGQDLARRLAFPDLLEELSQGLRLDDWAGAPELALVPAYWSTPLMYFGQVGHERDIRLFGARPPDASLVPGETVPDALLRTLKALSDPTRLRILHYLTGEPLAPAQLSRRLRLRAPTVVHHLKALRLAGLVQVTMANHKEAKRYAARPEAIRAACDALEIFVSRGE